MADNKAAAADAQSAIEFLQTGQNISDPVVLPIGQGVEDFAVKNERTENPTAPAQGFIKRGMIRVAQITAKPDQNRIEHG